MATKTVRLISLWVSKCVYPHAPRGSFPEVLIGFRNSVHPLNAEPGSALGT